MSGATCYSCKRDLPVGESAWAVDWVVIAPDKPLRTETRYTCDECVAAA